MSRQSNFAKKQFFQKSMARANIYAKKKKDIQMMKSGEVLPDPSSVIESTEDVQEADPEEVVDES